MIISDSALKAKIKRSGVILNKTFLWEEREKFLKNLNPVDIFLSNYERILLMYLNDDKDKWILTNRRLLMPNELTQIILSEVDKIDIDDIKKDPTVKMTNTRLYFHMNDRSKKIIKVEEKSWHLFYDVFKWMIRINKNG